MSKNFQFGIFVLVFTICACASSPPPELVNVSDEGSQTEYLIGPGDNLEIYVWRNPEVSRTVTVRPDGKISTPLVEDMVAVGKTPTMLARDIEGVLSKYIKSPVVNIIVGGFTGQFSEQIRVVGEAVEPRAISYRENISLLDVMIEVGGITEFAAGNRAKVIRKHGGKSGTIPVRIDDLINKGDMKQNIRMLPGDVIIIPESFF